MIDKLRKWFWGRWGWDAITFGDIVKVSPNVSFMGETVILCRPKHTKSIKALIDNRHRQYLDCEMWDRSEHICKLDKNNH